MNLNDLKISTRLFALIGSLSLLLIGIGTMGLLGIRNTNDAIKTVYEDRTVPSLSYPNAPSLAHSGAFN